MNISLLGINYSLLNYGTLCQSADYLRCHQLLVYDNVVTIPCLFHVGLLFPFSLHLIRDLWYKCSQLISYGILLYDVEKTWKRLKWPPRKKEVIDLDSVLLQFIYKVLFFCFVLFVFVCFVCLFFVFVFCWFLYIGKILCSLFYLLHVDSNEREGHIKHESLKWAL